MENININGMASVYDEDLETRLAVVNFPYFVFRDRDYGEYFKGTEIRDIAMAYACYNNGVSFIPDNLNGRYSPSDMRFKTIKSLIDKEARFMFSQKPDINLKPYLKSDNDDKAVETYKKIVSKVLKSNKFYDKLLKSARDCFIGKRVAFLVDYSEKNGVGIHAYNSLQFYYEYYNDTDELSLFISFERISDRDLGATRRYVVNEYRKDYVTGIVSVKSGIYSGSGDLLETIVAEKETDLEYIPAVIVLNDGLLGDKLGTSEALSLAGRESGYNKISNSDVDSERKGMNPIIYVVDMNTETTGNLSTGPGAFWEFKSDQNLNETKTQIGTIQPQLNHVDAVKTTLERIRSSMYEELDVPDVTSQMLSGVITSGKTINALYWPLSVRCDEKMKIWGTAIEFIINAVIDLVYLNKEFSKQIYKVDDVEKADYFVEVVANYALVSEENEEKQVDLDEIGRNVRSRKSYIEKWRKEEFVSSDSIDDELMQIAIEQNMLDTLSVNSSVVSEMERRNAETLIEKSIQDMKNRSIIDGAGDIEGDNE